MWFFFLGGSCFFVLKSLCVTRINYSYLIWFWPGWNLLGNENESEIAVIWGSVEELCWCQVLSSCAFLEKLNSNHCTAHLFPLLLVSDEVGSVDSLVQNKCHCLQSISIAYGPLQLLLSFICSCWNFWMQHQNFPFASCILMRSASLCFLLVLMVAKLAKLFPYSGMLVWVFQSNTRGTSTLYLLKIPPTTWGACVALELLFRRAHSVMVRKVGGSGRWMSAAVY